MDTDQRTKFHHAANNARELRAIKAQERIAENLGLIAQTLGLIYSKLYNEEYPQERVVVRNGAGKAIAMEPEREPAD